MITLALVAHWAQVSVLGQQSAFDPFAPTGSSGGTSQNIIKSLQIEDQVTKVFKVLSDATGWSFAISPSVSANPPKVTLYVKNMTAEQILAQVGVLGGLVIERKGTTVSVMTFDEHAKAFGLEKHVMVLRHAGARAVADSLRPFAETQERGPARIVADEASNKLILLLPQPLLDSVLKLAESLDVPLQSEVIQVIPLTHLEASEVAAELERFFQVGAAGGRPPAKPAPLSTASAPAEPEQGERAVGQEWRVQFMIESRLNAIVLRGGPVDVAKTAKLIAELDVPPQTRVVNYQLQYTSARELFDSVQGILESDRNAVRAGGGTPRRPRCHLSLSEQNNSIVAEGTEVDHLRIRSLIEAIDRPLPAGSGGMRVYRLENATADEVAEVLTSLVEGADGRALAVREGGEGSARGGISTAAQPKGPYASGGPAIGAAPAKVESAGAPQPAAGDVGAPMITAAPQINAIIIRASAAQQEEFAAVIRELDQPRDQVMLEVTLVTLRSTGTFNLGVELGAARLGGNGAQVIGFDTFGIGKADSSSGAIRIASPPPMGLNFAVFNSDDFSLVINALKTIGEVRLSSSPRILVEDNSVAHISQLNDEPYSLVSQGETSTVTSFGGYESAGVALDVVPHISKANWLRLEYGVVLSAFGKSVSTLLPPSRLQNSVQGVVRVPAEYTVVLGGLVGKHTDHSTKAVPFISDVPCFGELFKSRDNTDIYDTLYVFIRPVILRDTTMERLLAISQVDLARAGLPADQLTNDLKLLPSSGADVRTENP